MLESINDFIQDESVQDYSQFFRLSNLFGWFGLPFLSLGVLGVMGWPVSIIRHMRDD